MQSALLCPGVDERIENPSVFENILFQSSFEEEAVLLEDARGGRVVFIKFGADAVERKIVETIVSECADGFTHHAMAPKCFAQPIAQLGHVSMDVLAKPEADAATNLVSYFDA